MKRIGDDDWDNQSYIDVRNGRSSIESLMFTLKFCYHFDEVSRRGIENVRMELLEKIIAYNLCRSIELKKRLLKKQAA